MKITTKEILYSTEMHTCKNCGHVFKGKICNNCGEKIFSEKQLTTKHFLHQVIDFFYHWESKVLKTIKLNFLKPGFITQENLRGVRAPYAKPVQLYLVVAFAFFVIVGKVGQTDYIPSADDHHYYGLSAYPLFKWAKPMDEKVEASIDSLWVKKGREIEKVLQQRLKNNFVTDNRLTMSRKGKY